MTKIKHENQNMRFKPKEFSEDGWAPFVQKEDNYNVKINENKNNSRHQKDLFGRELEVSIDSIAEQTKAGSYKALENALQQLTQDPIKIENLDSYQSLHKTFFEKIKDIESKEYLINENLTKAKLKLIEYKKIISYLNDLEKIIKNI